MAERGLPPRWTKLLRDVRLEAGRFAATVLAVSASLVALGVVLGTHDVLTREMARNYLETRPAEATIELGGDAATAAAQVLAMPEVAEVEVGEVQRASLLDAEGWRPLLLFVVDDPAGQQIGLQRPVEGPVPTPEGTAAVERTAAELFALAPGETVRIRAADGAEGALRVGSIVHDPGLAPAWQERTAYAYVSRATLAGALGRPVALHDLRLRFRGVDDTAGAERAARSVATALASSGFEVHQVRVPPFERHPHQLQMVTVLTVLLSFAGLALVLSGLLVATSLASLLARQVREIGVLKTLGATSGQIAQLYAAWVAALGAAAVALSLPLGAIGAAVLTTRVAGLLNFELTSVLPSHRVFVLQAAVGIAVPLLVAAWPIARAARITVREALDQHGVGAGTLGPAFARWPRVARSLVRRPGRLALALVLLGSAGAMFVTARDVAASWDLNLERIAETRFDDAELRFAVPVQRSALDAARAVDGMGVLEEWQVAPVSFSRDGVVDVSRTWPDRGHGSLVMIGIPPETGLLRPRITSGRWLRTGDRDAVVLNQGALARRPDLMVGDRVELAVEGESRTWELVGVFEEVGSAGAAYVERGAFPAAAGTVSMLRFAAEDPTRAEVVTSAVEEALAGAPVELLIRRSELELGVSGHIEVLVQALTAMALILALVGGLGLATTTAIQVTERTREIGVTKTLGATPGQVALTFLGEALTVGVVSLPLSFGASVPLTLWMDSVIGGLGFVAPLPFAWSPMAALGWAVMVVVISAVASLSPALRAGELTVAEALAST